MTSFNFASACVIFPNTPRKIKEINELKTRCEQREIYCLKAPLKAIEIMLKFYHFIKLLQNPFNNHL